MREVQDIANLNVHKSTIPRLVENLGFDCKVVNKKKALMKNSNKGDLSGLGNMLIGLL